jgi:hypothetical protein
MGAHEAGLRFGMTAALFLSCSCARTTLLDENPPGPGAGRDAASDANEPLEGGIGSIEGHPFTGVTATASGFSGRPGDTQGPVIYVLSGGSGCDAFTTISSTHDSTNLDIYPATPAAGVRASGTFEAFAHVRDGTCNDLLLHVDDAGRLANATMTGTVTITSTSPDVVGSFDLEFPSGRLAGTFDAIECLPPAGGPPDASCL